MTSRGARSDATLLGLRQARWGSVEWTMLCILFLTYR